MLMKTANPRRDEPNHDPWAACADALRGTMSENTEQALRSDWKIFSTWCTENERNPLPADPDTVAAFVDAMAERRAPATVRRYVASIVAGHRIEGFEQAIRTEPVRQALKRMHRKKGRRQAQAKALNRPLIERMLAVGGDSLIESRNRAMLAVAYDGLFRQSELVGLLTEDLVVEQDGSSTVLVRQSKTDAEGEGDEQWLAPGTTAILQTWLARSGVQEGQMFRSLGTIGRVGGPLRPSSVAGIFKKMARKSGLPAHMAKKVSGHSTRVGATQDMVAGGISLPCIMQAGRWKSEASVARYAGRMLARRGGAAQLARLQHRI